MEKININIKCSTGEKIEIEIDPEITIADLKVLLEDKSKIPSVQQRLIYSGHVLKDPQTINSYNVKDGHTVHLVKGATPQQQQAAQNPPPQNNNVPFGSNQGSTPGFGGMGGFGGLGGMGGFQNIQQQMMQNPEMMREMMNSPMMQSMLDNPELLRTMFNSNPQMQQVLEQNPELRSALNDPTMLRQAFEAMRNPEMMREMMRTQDRTMSNIESLPGGFNALRRMYTEVQEPMMDAMQNPFASLLGQNAGGNSENANNNDNQQNEPNDPNPNSSPLPNPWAPNAGAQNAGAQNANPFASLFGGAQPNSNTQNTNNPFGGSLGMDPTQVSQMMQNPAVQNMMQQLFSNPQLLQQMLNTPMMQQMLQSQPGLAQMMQNPQFLQQMSNPQFLQQMTQMQQAFSQQPGFNLFGMGGAPQNTPSSGDSQNSSNSSASQNSSEASSQSSSSSSTPPSSNNAQQPNPFDFLNMMGGMGGMGGLNQNMGGMAPQSNPNELYATQLQQLNEMGFTDVDSNIRALQQTGGNVNAAIERLFGN